MNKWIAVADRRPTLDDFKDKACSNVLVASAHGTVRDCYWKHLVDLWDSGVREGDGCYYTHWMFMPEPPNARHIPT